MLAWTDAVSNSPLANSYIVTAFYNNLWTNVTRGLTANTVTVRGIPPGVNVTCCVATSNAMGISTATCVNTTAASLPSRPLSSPRCGDVTLTSADASLVINWDPVVSSQMNGAPLLQYHIGVTIGALSVYTNADATTTSAQLNALPAGQTIGVQYSTCNAIGCSEMSATTMCTLIATPPAPTTPVAYITAFNVTTQTVQVSDSLKLFGFKLLTFCNRWIGHQNPTMQMVV